MNIINDDESIEGAIILKRGNDNSLCAIPVERSQFSKLISSPVFIQLVTPPTVTYQPQSCSCCQYRMPPPCCSCCQCRMPPPCCRMSCPCGMMSHCMMQPTFY